MMDAAGSTMGLPSCSWFLHLHGLPDSAAGLAIQQETALPHPVIPCARLCGSAPCRSAGYEPAERHMAEIRLMYMAQTASRQARCSCLGLWLAC